MREVLLARLERRAGGAGKLADGLAPRDSVRNRQRDSLSRCAPAEWLPSRLRQPDPGWTEQRRTLRRAFWPRAGAARRPAGLRACYAPLAAGRSRIWREREVADSFPRALT